jgi:NAD-dependent deacetylase
MAALTGAGISTAAGIPDFRGPEGLYVTRRYDPERTFDIREFDRDPRYFFAFARDFARLLERVRPTFTHRFLAALEACGTLGTVITQNIDGLHQRAGSRRVIELHGSAARGRCRSCGTACGAARLREKLLEGGVAVCDGCGGVVKPDIVFFGEPVEAMAEATEAARAADLLLVIGSSLTVYPAAMLPEQTGGAVVVVNRGPVEARSPDWLFVDEAADAFFVRITGRCGLAVPGGLDEADGGEVRG